MILSIRRYRELAVFFNYCCTLLLFSPLRLWQTQTKENDFSLPSLCSPRASHEAKKMEMDDITHDEHIQVTSAEGFMSVNSSEGDITEDLPAPRIGDEYQAVIPSLQQFDCLEYVDTSKVYGTTNREQKLGPDVPISWVSCQEFDISQHYSRDRVSNSRSNHQNISCCQGESTDEVSYCDKHLEGISAGNGLHVDSTITEKSADYMPIPCVSSEDWDDDEIESFILGLYIFGKNLASLHKFVESKKMGDILSFYYGKFYMSKAHRKWSECKKSKGRKRVIGHHLLVGWRQHELLSRLSSNVPEESKKCLSEATRMFNEQGTSLEQYVFTLKSIVGVKSLVVAVAIGKGKCDLTSAASDQARGNQVRSIHPEIPTGKACSSLTDEEVVKFLTGDYRLSKARSNDLFWEAVWPRLLARGWHSEQPKYQVTAASKHSLIFLIPGIKKFSRRKLTKGDHYFDSITDVLNKVALDPRLLEMGSGNVNNGAAGNGCGSGNGATLECNGVASNQSGDHLHQKTSNPSSKKKASSRPSCLMKFTIVDTSLVCDETPFRVRELRCLPLDNSIGSLCSSTSDEMESSSSKEHNSGDELVNCEEKQSLENSKDRKLENKGRYKNSKDQKLVNKGGGGCSFGRGTKTSEPYCFSNISRKNEQKHDLVECKKDKKMKQFKKRMTKCGRPINYVATVPKRKRAAFELSSAVPSIGGHNKEPIKHQFTRRRKSANSKYVSLASDQSMITAHIVPEDGRSCSLPQGPPRLEEEEEGSRSKTFDAIVNLAAELCQPHCNAPCSSSVKNGLKGDGESTSTTLMEPREEKGKYKGLIDLNLPQCPPEFVDADGQYLLDVPVAQSSHGNPTSLRKGEHVPDAFSGFETAMESRRQSTRNRPLTTRALEALESGFLNIKRRARGYRFPNADASRTSRQSHKNSAKCGSSSGGIEMRDRPTDAKREEECTGYSSEVAFSSKSHFELANA